MIPPITDPITVADVDAWLTDPLYVDTALSWDGRFPPVDEGDVFVVLSADDDYQVIVSRRYTRAADLSEAAAIARDAIAERYGTGDAAVITSCRPIVRRVSR